MILMSGKRLGKSACMNCRRHTVSSSGAPTGQTSFVDSISCDPEYRLLWGEDEEDGFAAAIEVGKECVECGIGNRLSENECAGGHAHHSQFVERAARFLDGRLDVRQWSAGEGHETLRVFANDSARRCTLPSLAASTASLFLAKYGSWPDTERTCSSTLERSILRR